MDSGDYCGKLSEYQCRAAEACNPVVARPMFNPSRSEYVGCVPKKMPCYSQPVCAYKTYHAHEGVYKFDNGCLPINTRIKSLWQECNAYNAYNPYQPFTQEWQRTLC